MIEKPRNKKHWIEFFEKIQNMLGDKEFLKNCSKVEPYYESLIYECEENSNMNDLYAKIGRLCVKDEPFGQAVFEWCKQVIEENMTKEYKDSFSSIDISAFKGNIKI